MSITERLKLIIEEEGITRPALERKTGIKVKRWSNIFNGTAKLYADEVEAICKLWPQYAYWLCTNEELQEAGQVRPAVLNN